MRRWGVEDLEYGFVVSFRTVKFVLLDQFQTVDEYLVTHFHRDFLSIAVAADGQQLLSRFLIVTEVVYSDIKGIHASASGEMIGYELARRHGLALCTSGKAEGHHEG
jgi:hypothetical protein